MHSSYQWTDKNACKACAQSPFQIQCDRFGGGVWQLLFVHVSLLSHFFVGAVVFNDTWKVIRTRIEEKKRVKKTNNHFNLNLLLMASGFVLTRCLLNLIENLLSFSIINPWSEFETRTAKRLLVLSKRSALTFNMNSNGRENLERVFFNQTDTITGNDGNKVKRPWDKQTWYAYFSATETRRAEQGLSCRTCRKI